MGGILLLLVLFAGSFNYYGAVDEQLINAAIHSIGLKYGLRDEEVRKIVNSPYKFTRETITKLELDNIETEEQFDELKINFIYLIWF